MSDKISQITINLKDKRVATMSNGVFVTRRIHSCPHFTLVVRRSRIEFGNEIYDLLDNESASKKLCLNFTLLAVTDKDTALTWSKDLITLTAKDTYRE